MNGRLWSYKELKHIIIHGERPPEELALELNRLYHDGEVVRTSGDVVKIRARGTILDK
jgi:hypothetical protein